MENQRKIELFDILKDKLEDVISHLCDINNTYEKDFDDLQEHIQTNIRRESIAEFELQDLEYIEVKKQEGLKEILIKIMEG